MSSRNRPDKTGPAFPSSRRWHCSWVREAGIFPPEVLPRAVATLFWSEPEAWQNWRRCESPRCECLALRKGRGSKVRWKLHGAGRNVVSPTGSVQRLEAEQTQSGVAAASIAKRPAPAGDRRWGTQRLEPAPRAAIEAT